MAGNQALVAKPKPAIIADICLVGGGASGGRWLGAGGGCGELREWFGVGLASGTYQARIGGGGPIGAPDGNDGRPTTLSAFLNGAASGPLYYAGGGGFGAGNDGVTVPNPGSQGTGGGGGGSTDGQGLAPPNSLLGAASLGSAREGGCNGINSAGGGGGARRAGIPGGSLSTVPNADGVTNSNGVGAAGGAGKTCQVDGVTRAGGGGGSGNPVGAGGLGGGGDAGLYTGVAGAGTPGVAGTDGLGGGGGGGGTDADVGGSNAQYGGRGGAGCFAIRYPGPQQFTGGTVSQITVNGVRWTLHVFNGSGTSDTVVTFTVP